MDPRVAHILEMHGISARRTEAILRSSDYGRRRHENLDIKEFPDIDGTTVINARSGSLLHSFQNTSETLQILGCDPDQAKKLIASALAASDHPEARTENGTLFLNKKGLTRLGTFLVPLVSFGVLNGGSASSYFDDKKNKEFAPHLFDEFADLIHGVKKGDVPKGLTPAYFNPDGSPGHNFLTLKLRIWLRTIRDYQKAAEESGLVLPWHGLEKNFPVFQMTSTATDAALQKAFAGFTADPFLKPLLSETGVRLDKVLSAVQELVAAFTPGQTDGRRDVFLTAFGEAERPLGFPAGHGQNFAVLQPVYETLFGAGKRFAYLGNVDNVGFFPDPASIAMTALTRADASFEFSFRTPMDHKGGVLVRRRDGKLCTADIGQSVDRDIVDKAESAGTHILFNCATGLFDLRYLSGKLDHISHELPVRFADQDKDAGRYSQAEQSTWEVIAILDKPLILAVEKRERFLAAKLFMDCLLTSGMGQKLTESKELSPKEQSILAAAQDLSQGLVRILSSECGMRLENGRWS